MRYELEKFFSNPCESSGLLIAEAPTGYGKTYETIQAIYRYIEKGGKSQILFITNLLKNLPEDELRNIYEQNGRGILFKKRSIGPVLCCLKRGEGYFNRKNSA
ncbi:MAG: DEAD/DEAH box helicase family protein [Intestinimonas sp.]